MQHSEGESCPLSTIRVHRRVLWRTWWNLPVKDIHSEVMELIVFTGKDTNVTLDVLDFI